MALPVLPLGETSACCSRSHEPNASTRGLLRYTAFTVPLFDTSHHARRRLAKRSLAVEFCIADTFCGTVGDKTFGRYRILVASAAATIDVTG